MSTEQEQIKDQLACAVEQEFSPWIKFGLELPNTSVKELARITGMNPRIVLQTLSSGELILNGKLPAVRAVTEQDSKTITTPKFSETYQRELANIQSDGQRWQRSPQFPARNKGKTTKSRALARTIESQISQAKVKFVPLEKDSTSPQIESRTIQKWVDRASLSAMSDSEKFRFVLDKEKFFPTQNPNLIYQRISEADDNNPFSLACFVCLNIPCKPNNLGKPTYEVNSDITDQTRLALPAFKRRTEIILDALEKTNLPFTWNLIIADTDANDVYGEWLKDPEQSEAILKFKRQIEAVYEDIPQIQVNLWSDLEKPYIEQYQRDLQECIIKASDLIGQEALDQSFARRLKYFKGLGFSETPKIQDICELTARRNIALYAAQGPIIKELFDCLVIADPDPTRLGRNQSLLTPDLSIWYPYRG